MNARRKSQPAQSPKPEQSAGVNETNDSLRRLAADFANYQRRAEQEKLLAASYGKKDVLEKLFPLFDNLHLAISHVPSDPTNTEQISPYLQGIKQIENQLEEGLALVGLKRMNCAGESFDPQIHEAVSYESSPEVPADHIIAEVEAGWLLDGQVIKPAKVRVSKGD